MLTRSCQFACDYCEVALGPESMPLPILMRAIDLLMTTDDERCQLRFWGGEPLIKWASIKKAVDYAQKRAVTAKKSIKFMITTNGYLLDEKKLRYLEKNNFEAMLSFDGNEYAHDRHRHLKNRKGTYTRTLENLRRLASYNIPYFVNLVVTPDTVGVLSDSLEFLKNNSIASVQICYRCGVAWRRKASGELLAQLENFLGRGNRADFIMNFHNDCEPTMLSQEILVDVDGRIYYDAAIFLEKKFPSLKKSYELGNIGGIKNIGRLYASKPELRKRFLLACSEPQKKIFLNNEGLGLKMKAFFEQRNQGSISSNEHPVIGPVAAQGFREQNKILIELDIDAVFMKIEGPCLNDCVFCRQKTSSAFDALPSILERLGNGRGSVSKKLCLIGNEPMLHPKITQILRKIKKSGFSMIEIMTSGNMLADPAFTKKVVDAGATSFSIPLFSNHADVHDAIVGRKGACNSVIRGIENALRSGAQAFIHTNLIRQNIAHCLELERFVRKQLALPFAIFTIRPKTSNLAFPRLMPAYAEIISRLTGVKSMVGFPLCVTQKVQAELFKNENEISDSMKLYFLDQGFVKLRRCSGCIFIKKCAGIFREYARFFPTDEIRPITARHANTIH